jgi:hypothetical protein
MSGFALGVVSSVAATALLTLSGWLARVRLRRVVLRALSGLSGIGLDRMYPTQREANGDLAGDLARARWIKVLTGRGNELTRDSFQQTWLEADSRLESVQILLPDPDVGADSWLAERENEILRYDTGYRPGLLADQVRANVTYLNAVDDVSQRIEVRLIDLPTLCRLILTDELLYFTPYEGARHGRNSPCLVFRYPSPMYNFGVHTFQTAWLRARHPKERQ